MSDDHELALALDRASPNFAAGVELGMLYQRLRTEPLPLAAVIHARNAEMALRLAEAFGTEISADELDADWIMVTFS